MARPGSTAEVAAVVSACAAAGVAIVPQGGNTGLVGGQIPDASGGELLLSLRRLNRIREVDVDADAMIVEAGVTLAEAQAAAEAADRLFPLALASEGTATIGGNLSSNAGGVAVIAYGNARDLTLGVEVVLADGRVANLLSKLRKDNTGYDLKDLFVGAEGTLGIVTAASLKLFARPRARSTAFVGLADPERALTLLKMARARFGQQVTSFEIMPRIGMEFVLAYDAGARDPLADAHPWYALIEVSAQEEGGLDDALTAAARRRARARPDRRRGARRDARAARGVLAAARSDVRRAEAAGRLDQARRFRAGRAGSRLHRRSDGGGRGVHARRARVSRSAISATATSISTSASRSAPTSRRFSISGRR